jgi:hypothetical protein
MAWSVLIWNIYGFPKVSLYLERFVLKHATAHIHKRYVPYEKKSVTNQRTEDEK